MSETTLLGGPLSDETLKAIERESKRLEKVYFISDEIIKSYQNNELTLHTAVDYLIKALSKAPPVFNNDLNTALGKYVREIYALPEPKRSVRSKKGHPNFIINASRGMVKLAQKDGYSVNRATPTAFIFISDLWRDLGLLISASQVQSWYEHKQTTRRKR